MRILEVTIPPITSKTALLIPYSSEDIVGLFFLSFKFKYSITAKLSDSIYIQATHYAIFT